MTLGGWEGRRGELEDWTVAALGADEYLLADFGPDELAVFVEKHHIAP